MKTGFKVVLGIILIAVLVFGLGMAQLGWFKFFEPKKENVRREVFENTKSFTKGKTQDLAKYYEEWVKATSDEEKRAVGEMVKINFADFDSNKVNSPKLRQFLQNIRSY
jgi:mevalonate kinase